MDVLEAIDSRRSIGRVTADEPPRQAIERLLEAAVKAPNHHNNQPWRFFVLTGAAREQLGDVMVQSLQRRMAGQEADKVESMSMAERAKPLRAPVLIVVASKRSEDDHNHPLEDLQACAAAIQNLLLAAHSQGLAAQWRTGGAAYDDLVKAHFGLDARDEIAGFVYVGYPREGYEASPRPRSFGELTQWRS